MNHSLVSIIIPFYNEETYLARAVTSVLHQTYPDIELILVNDGSVDDSPAIAQKFADDNKHIILVNAQHCGPGNARNLGIKAASGNYIAFLDSDDELMSETVAKLVLRIEREEADIVISRYSYHDAQGKSIRISGWHLDGTPQDSFTCACAMYEYKIANTCWAKLYRAAIVKQVSFAGDLWFQDMPFLLSCFLKAEKICFESEPLWKNHSRPSSVTRRTIEQKRIEDSGKIFIEELNIIKGTAHQHQYESVLFAYQVDILMNNLIILCSDKKRVQNISELQKCFDHWLSDYLKRLKRSKQHFRLRTWLDLKIINLYKIIGWRALLMILPYLKPARYKDIRSLRTA